MCGNGGGCDVDIELRATRGHGMNTYIPVEAILAKVQSLLGEVGDCVAHVHSLWQ